MLPATTVARRVIATGRPAFAQRNDGGEEIRLYVAPLPDVRGAAAGGAVVVAASTSDVAETIHALHVGVIVSALAAAVAGAAAVAVLLGRALRPLKRLARAAGEMERTGDRVVGCRRPVSTTKSGAWGPHSTPCLAASNDRATRSGGSSRTRLMGFARLSRPCAATSTTSRGTVPHLRSSPTSSRTQLGWPGSQTTSS